MKRRIDFAAYGVPAEGAVAVTVTVTVAQGAPLEGAYADVDRIADGALQRAVATAGFAGDRGTILNLPGLGPYRQVRDHIEAASGE